MYQSVELLVPIFGIVFVFGSPIAIVWLVMRAQAKKRQLLHDTIDKMIDSGQPVPMELIETFDKDKPKNNLSRGVTLIATGLGVAIFLSTLVGTDIATVALIPLFMGIAYLILYKLDKPQQDA